MALRRFAWIAEGDVFMMFSFDDQNPRGERWAAGLNSNPIVVEVEENSDVRIGWTYVQNEFVAPVEPISENNDDMIAGI